MNQGNLNDNVAGDKKEATVDFDTATEESHQVVSEQTDAKKADNTDDGLSEADLASIEASLLALSMSVGQIEQTLDSIMNKSNPQEWYNSEAITSQIQATMAKVPVPGAGAVGEVVSAPVEMLAEASMRDAWSIMLEVLLGYLIGRWSNGDTNKSLKAIEKGMGSLEKGMGSLEKGMGSKLDKLDNTMRKGFRLPEEVEKPKGLLDANGRPIERPDGDVDRGKGSASSGKVGEAEGGKTSRKTGLSALGAKGVAKIVGKAALRLVPGIGQALLVADIASMAVGMAGHVQGMIEAKKNQATPPNNEADIANLQAIQVQLEQLISECRKLHESELASGQASNSSIAGSQEPDNEWACGAVRLEEKLAEISAKLDNPRIHKGEYTVKLASPIRVEYDIYNKQLKDMIDKRIDDAIQDMLFDAYTDIPTPY